jgi:predicted nucleic acid-binding protein
MALIFWDTNLFVYFFEGNPEFGPTVHELGRRMQIRGDRLLTSTSTLGEILVRPIRDKDAVTERQYRTIFLRPDIQIATFDQRAAEYYARVRQDSSIAAPDAIQLACAAAAGANLFITNDDRLSRKSIAGIDFVTSLARTPI